MSRFTQIYEHTAMYSKERLNTIKGVLFEDNQTKKAYVGCLDDLEFCHESDRHTTPFEALLERSNAVRNKPNFSDGTLYLTYQIDEETVNDIVRLGFKNITYASLVDMDPKYANILAQNSISYTRYPREYKYSDEWWTDTFYNKAYDIVKDRKAPMTIISYNRPTVPTLKHFHVDEMTEELNWPFIVFVRESQKAMYEQNLSKYKYVTVVSFPDNFISNAGAVRRASQKWLYQQGYKIAIQSDDDNTLLTYSRPGYCQNGVPKAEYVEGTNICKVAAMWQLAMEEAIKRDNVYMSCSMPIGFSWKSDYCTSSSSYLVSRGSFTGIVCWNVKGMVEDSIYYRDNPLVGLDDIDMEIRVVESGHNVCNFVWLVNNGDPMSAGQPFEELYARFKDSQDKLRVFHEHLPWVKFRIKRKLEQVCVDFPAVRRWQVENGYRNTLDYIYDIWEDGKLVEV